MDTHMEMVNHCHCVSVNVCGCQKEEEEEEQGVHVCAYAHVGGSTFQQKA